MYCCVRVLWHSKLPRENAAECGGASSSGRSGMARSSSRGGAAHYWRPFSFGGDLMCWDFSLRMVSRMVLLCNKVPLLDSLMCVEEYGKRSDGSGGKAQRARPCVRRVVFVTRGGGGGEVALLRCAAARAATRLTVVVVGAAPRKS